MNSILKDLESIKGYVFPFEGEKHWASVVLVPYRKDTWRENALPAIEEYLNVVKAISTYERVIVIIDPRIDYAIVRRFEMKNTHILRLKYDDSWARDTLPVFLKNDSENRLVGVDFGFNSWGGDYDGLYTPYDDDNQLGKNFLLEAMIHRYARKDFILEGGSIHTDGEGTLITTEECLLSKGRNPSLTKEEIEENLKSSLNVEKVLFLPYGIFEDETNGHVDNICCFLKPGVVLLAWCDDENDPQYERCVKDYEYLSSVTDSKGRSLTIIKMPLPKTMYMSKDEANQLTISSNAISRLEGRRLAGSYVNFYMGEKFIILPQFGCDEDSKAVEILKDFYKEEKDIIPVHSKEILLGGGNIHCITKQIPYMDHYPLEPEDEDL